MANQIQCKKMNYLGYRYPVNMDEPVCTNSMCNNLGRLYQGWEKHAGTNTIELILHKEKKVNKGNLCESGM